MELHVSGMVDPLTHLQCCLAGLHVRGLRVLGTNNRRLLWNVFNRFDRHNGAMNKSVKLEPGATEWNQTCYKDYTWSMLNCNGEFQGKYCSSAEKAMYLDVLSYCRQKRAPLSSSLY